MCPSNTVLDDSIGCAIWFAARGEGVIRPRDEEEPVPYTSPARVSERVIHFTLYNFMIFISGGKKEK